MKFKSLGAKPSRFRVLALLIAQCVLPIGTAIAQERPKSDEFSRFESLKSGSQPLDASAKELLDKVAKYYAGRLSDPALQKDGMSQHVQEFIRRLLVPPQNPYPRLNAEQKKFVDEFGKAMITQLEPLALNNSKPIVRVNAARMASEVARGGYDGAAELFLKLLDMQNGTDGERFWALRGLNNLFSIEPEKDILPGKTIFQKQNNLQVTPLERNAIRTLISFVQRKPANLPEDAPAEEVDAFRYVRCEAIRALGKVRVQTIKNLGQVEGRPALALLRASRSDGMSPPTSAKERVEAIVGFCQLLADKDRDMQLDYAVNHIGQAIAELAAYKNANPGDVSIPWKVAGERIQEALDKWDAGANALKLANASLVQGLNNMAKTHVLIPLAAGQEGNSPNIEPLRNWLSGQVKLEPNASLFKSDPESKLTAK